MEKMLACGDIRADDVFFRLVGSEVPKASLVLLIAELKGGIVA